MSNESINFSFDGELVSFDVKSGCLVIIDPLYFEEIKPVIDKFDFSGSDTEKLRKDFIKLEKQALLYGGGALLGFCKIKNFKPGKYTLKIQDIKYIEDDETKEALEKTIPVFGLDSAQFFILDISFLRSFTEKFDYERLEPIFEGKPEGTDFFENLAKEFGGRYFAYVSSPGCDSGFEFEGDGSYTLSVSPVN
jgi:hypothetical protein